MSVRAKRGPYTGSCYRCGQRAWHFRAFNCMDCYLRHNGPAQYRRTR